VLELRLTRAKIMSTTATKNGIAMNGSNKKS